MLASSICASGCACKTALMAVLLQPEVRCCCARICSPSTQPSMLVRPCWPWHVVPVGKAEDAVSSSVR